MKKKEFAFFIVALLILSLVIIDIYWWIQISSNHAKSLVQVNKEYLENFGGLIKNGHQVSILNIILTCMAGFLFHNAMSIRELKTSILVLIFLCFIIGSWQLFTLL